MSNSNETQQNTTTNLRSHLFKQIERLNDPTLDLEKELEKAKAMASIGNVIVNSVKIEIDFVRVTGGKKTNTSKKLSDGQ